VDAKDNKTCRCEKHQDEYEKEYNKNYMRDYMRKRRQSNKC